jgi:hypothetical protein
MFNFKKLVHNILLEAEPTINPVDPQQDNTNDIQNIQKSPGFMRVVGAYTSQYNQTPVIRDILKAVNVIVGGGYIAAKYTAVGYIPFIDAFAQIYTKIKDDKKSEFTLSQIINAITQDPATFEPIFNNTAKAIIATSTVTDYEPVNPDVNRAWRSLMSETNKLSQVAIQSLGSDTVHSAITKIIAKRIPILDRITGLKGLFKPFNRSVIIPILFEFKKYTGYKQGDFAKNPQGWLKDRLWPKKVPGDFSKMVEDITANNILNIAIHAYEYYIYLLRSKYLTKESLNIHEAAAGYTKNYSDSFDNIFNKKTTNSNTQQNNKQQTAILDDQQIEKISQQIGSATNTDYKSFIDTGVSQYLPDTKYDLTAISKDPSKEAKALYKALTDMAYFIRPRLSAAQRIGNAVSAIGALRTGMGPVN